MNESGEDLSLITLVNNDEVSKVSDTLETPTTTNIKQDDVVQEDVATTKQDSISTLRRKRDITMISKSEENNTNDENNQTSNEENNFNVQPTASPSTSSNSSGPRSRTKEVISQETSSLPSSRTRKNTSRNYIEEENESACCECEGGGELICCDTCVRAYHSVCLPMRYRPPEQSDSAVSNEWSCPVCLYFRVHDDLEKRRGILLTLQHPLCVPSRDCDPRVKKVKSRRALDADDYSDDSDDSGDAVSSPHHSMNKRPKRFTHQDLYRQSHHHYLFEDIKKRKTSTLIGAPTDSETQSESAVGSRTRRQAAAVNEKKGVSSATSSTPSTCGTIGRMNVGPSFQIPQLPLPFLEVHDLGRSYDRTTDFRYARAMADCRVVYSASEWKRRAERLQTVAPFELYGETEPTQNNDAVIIKSAGKEIASSSSVGTDISADVSEEVTAESSDVEETEEMKSVKLLLKEMEEVVGKRKIVEACAIEKDNFVDSEDKLKEFCRILASRWSSRCNWPYSDEYAYKILHHAKFDAKEALASLEDPSFDFLVVCDPPMRPYFNKWRPKDKRSMFPSTPFPPPSHFRAIFNNGGARTRQQVNRIDPSILSDCVCSSVDTIRVSLVVLSKCCSSPTVVLSSMSIHQAFYVLGLTGNIGTGKSTCANALKDKGILVIDVDKLGHEVYTPGSSILPQLVETFGESILQNGIIHRPSLGKLVFGDSGRLKQLTDLVWPEIRRLTENIIENVRSQNTEERRIVVIDAAVLIEAGWQSLVDHVIILNVKNKSEIYRRLLLRNPELTSDDIEKRILSQLSLDQQVELLKKSNTPFTVLNSEGPKDELVNKCYQLIETLASANTDNK